MKNKLLIILLFISAVASAQLTSPTYTRGQVGANWNFDEDTVHVNRLHVGDGKFGIDSLGRIIYYNNSLPTAGKMFYGNGTYFTTLSIGTANQILRVNAGATAPEWYTPTFGTGTVTSIATTSPITGGTITSTGTIGINDADDDGTTKGAASFDNTNFDATAGNVTIANDGIALGTKTTGNYVASIATTSPITGGAAGSEGAALTIAIPAAATATDGYLTSANWNTFNKKSGLVATPLNLTAQTAAIAATTYYTTPAADGWYRVTISGTITTTGTTPDIAAICKWTDANDNVVKTWPGGTVNSMNRTNANNTGTGTFSLTTVIYAKATTAIQYQINMSGTATYDLTMVVEQLQF